MNKPAQCATCHKLMSDAEDDNFVIGIMNRNDVEIQQHCSAVCGLKMIRDFEPGPTFRYLRVGFDRYDLAVLQQTLKGTAL